jgi:hypothetical protein
MEWDNALAANDTKGKRDESGNLIGYKGNYYLI